MTFWGGGVQYQQTFCAASNYQKGPCDDPKTGKPDPSIAGDLAPGWFEFTNTVPLPITYMQHIHRYLHSNSSYSITQSYTIRSRYSSTLPPRCWMCSPTPRCLTALRVRYHFQPFVAACLLDVLDFIVSHCPIVSFSLQLCGWVERRSVQRKRGGLSTPGQRAVSLSRYSGGKFPAIGDRAASELLATELCCQRPLN